MPKATLTVHFKRPTDPNWIRRPTVYGSTCRVRSGFAQFRDRISGQTWVEEVPDNYTFDIRIEDGLTTYKPAGIHEHDSRRDSRISRELETRGSGWEPSRPITNIEINGGRIMFNFSPGRDEVIPYAYI
jgi:hypothetical protein